MRGRSHPLGSICVSAERYVLAEDTREAPVPDDEEQSVGLNAGHMTPARRPSTCKVTNASENVAGEISTSIKIRLSPVNLAVIVVQQAACSSDARAKSNSGLMRYTRSKARRVDMSIFLFITRVLQSQRYFVLPRQMRAVRLPPPPPSPPPPPRHPFCSCGLEIRRS